MRKKRTNTMPKQIYPNLNRKQRRALAASLSKDK
jgi:hypothetical protein|tara:strand:+ start:383 stop:484 length:102 start_codon:yes stop_codon:yes gene_type:complete